MIEQYYDRCGDCGGDIKESKVSKRHNVCDDCWGRRGWIVEHMNDVVSWIGMADFQKLQRSMAYKTGTAKRKIVKLMAETGAKK